MNRYIKIPLSLQDAVAIWESMERRVSKVIHGPIRIQEQFEILSKHILEITGEGVSNTLLRDSLYYPIKNKMPVIKISRRTIGILKQYINEQDVKDLIDQINFTESNTFTQSYNGKWECFRWHHINNRNIIVKSILELNNTHNHTFEASWNDPLTGTLKGWGKLYTNTMSIIIDNSNNPLMIMADFSSLIQNDLINLLSGIIISSQGYGKLATQISLVKCNDKTIYQPELIENTDQLYTKIECRNFRMHDAEFLCIKSVIDAPPDVHPSSSSSYASSTGLV